MSRFGLAVRRYACKRKDLGSIPLRLSLLFKKVVVCGHCLVTLSIKIFQENNWFERKLEVDVDLLRISLQILQVILSDVSLS